MQGLLYTQGFNLILIMHHFWHPRPGKIYLSIKSTFLLLLPKIFFGQKHKSVGICRSLMSKFPVIKILSVWFVKILCLFLVGCLMPCSMQYWYGITVLWRFRNTSLLLMAQGMAWYNYLQGFNLCLCIMWNNFRRKWWNNKFHCCNL